MTALFDSNIKQKFYQILLIITVNISTVFSATSLNIGLSKDVQCNELFLKKEFNTFKDENTILALKLLKHEVEIIIVPGIYFWTLVNQYKFEMLKLLPLYIPIKPNISNKTDIENSDEFYYIQNKNSKFDFIPYLAIFNRDINSQQNQFSNLKPLMALSCFQKDKIDLNQLYLDRGFTKKDFDFNSQIYYVD